MGVKNWADMGASPVMDKSVNQPAKKTRPLSLLFFVPF